MNLIELQPGEAMYVPADGCHAWLDGSELASSWLFLFLD